MNKDNQAYKKLSLCIFLKNSKKFCKILYNVTSKWLNVYQQEPVAGHWSLYYVILEKGLICRINETLEQGMKKVFNKKEWPKPP